MMAITTRSSISVKPRRRPKLLNLMFNLCQVREAMGKHTGGATEASMSCWATSG